MDRIEIERGVKGEQLAIDFVRAAKRALEIP